MSDIFEACRRGDLERVKFHVSKDAAVVNKRDWGGGVPLHLACKKGQTAVVKFLAQNGAEVNYRSKDGWTPLHVASKYGHVDTVKVMVEKLKANPHEKDNMGEMPIHWTSYKGHVEVAKYLYEVCGCDIHHTNTHKENVIHLASKKNHLDLTLYYVSNTPVDANAKDADGNTPLSVAGSSEMEELLQRYLTSGVHRASCEGDVVAVRDALAADPKCIEMLDRFNQTPLYYASRLGKLGVVITLLLHNADISAKDEMGRSTIDVAKTEEMKELLTFFSHSRQQQKDLSTEKAARVAAEKEVERLKKEIESMKAQ
eukprot:GFYU01013029.1.p1 GENE.GFYU01013029.1~~GFYU01013029.1.p1  ORF type:complete len:326 (-),score=82.04 GFYU01013029.1:325-1263(-)